MRTEPSFLHLATEWSVVRRALGLALVVGPLLIAINHGDRLVGGDIDGVRLFKMSLTLLVPYCVSTYSSVGAIRARARADEFTPNSSRRASSRSGRGA